MSDRHLSQQQMSRLILGESTAEELQHSQECPDCREELGTFQAPVSTFRMALHDLSYRENIPALTNMSVSLFRPGRFFQPRGWALVGVTLVMLIAIPIYMRERDWTGSSEPAESSLMPRDGGVHGVAATNEDALFMDAFAAHLSRSVPAPMEPMLALLPEESVVEMNGSDRLDLTIPGAIR